VLFPFFTSIVAHIYIACMPVLPTCNDLTNIYEYRAFMIKNGCLLFSAIREIRVKQCEVMLPIVVPHATTIGARGAFLRENA